MSWHIRKAGHGGEEFAKSLEERFAQEVTQSHHNDFSRGMLATHADVAAKAARAAPADRQLLVTSNGHIGTDGLGSVDFKVEGLF